MIVHSAADVSNYLHSRLGDKVPDESRNEYADLSFRRGLESGNPVGTDWTQFLAGTLLGLEIHAAMAEAVRKVPTHDDAGWPMDQAKIEMPKE